MKTPFDVVKDLYSKKTIWNEDIAKCWNSFMINRILSMNENYVEFINTVQQLHNIPEENLHKVYLEFIPITNSFFKYIKAESSFTKDLNLIKLHLGLSKRDAIDYLKIMTDKELKELREREDPKPYTSKKLKTVTDVKRKN